MDAPPDILQGKWPELKFQAQLHWNKLTNDDIQQLSGATEELAHVLRLRYGYGKAQAEMEINNWLHGTD